MSISTMTGPGSEVCNAGGSAAEDLNPPVTSWRKSPLLLWGRVAAVALAAVLCLAVFSAGTAFANTEADQVTVGGEAQTDSYGVPLQNYQMDLDDGGFKNVGDPGKHLTLWVVESSWSIHLFCVDIVLWLLDTSHAATWLGFLVGPMHEASLVIREVFMDMGAPGMILAGAMLVGLIGILRGRMATAIVEMIITCAAVALFLGVVTDPVRSFTGEKGILNLAPQIGQKVSSEIVNIIDWRENDRDQGRDTPSMGNPRPTRPDANAFHSLTTKTADAFVRKPYEILMFGQPVPQECQGTLTEVLRDGPYDDRSGEIRKAVVDCDKTLEAATKQSTRAMVHGGPVYTSMAFLMLLAALFAITYVALMLFGLWEAASLTWRVLMAAFPSNRLKVLQSLIALIGIVVAQIMVSAGLTVLMVIIDRTLNVDDQNLFTKYMIVNVFILAAIMLLLVYLASFRRKSKERAGHVDGVGPSPGKEGQDQKDLEQLHRRVKNTKSQVVNGVQGTVRTVGTTKDRIVAAPGAVAKGANVGKRRVGKVAKMGWNVTLGTPVTVPRMVKKVRAAAKDRMDTARVHSTTLKKERTAYFTEYKSNLAAPFKAAKGSRETKPQEVSKSPNRGAAQTQGRNGASKPVTPAGAKTANGKRFKAASEARVAEQKQRNKGKSKQKAGVS